MFQLEASLILLLAQSDPTSLYLHWNEDKDVSSPLLFAMSFKPQIFSQDK